MAVTSNGGLSGALCSVRKRIQAEKSLCPIRLAAAILILYNVLGLRSLTMVERSDPFAMTLSIGIVTVLIVDKDDEEEEIVKPVVVDVEVADEEPAPVLVSTSRYSTT